MTPTIAFFNPRGGVGRTTLVYHLAHMLVRMNRRVLLVDLDPQANLSELCLSRERLGELWSEAHIHTGTVVGSLRHLLGGSSDSPSPHVEPVGEALGLLVGDLRFYDMEAELSRAWLGALARADRSDAVLGAFHRLVQQAAAIHGADLVIVDISPGLGSINNAVLVAIDYLVTPLTPSFYSFHVLRALGSTLEQWRKEWQALIGPETDELPRGRMHPLGYVVMHGTTMELLSGQTTTHWLRQIPSEYHHHILHDGLAPVSLDDDPCHLGSLRYSHGLIHLALDARKPMFALKSADGAVGAYAKAVIQCEAEYRGLATMILDRVPVADGR